MKSTRQMNIGNVKIGGNAPISIQSMTNTDTHDANVTLAQVNALASAGADIVRVSVYDDMCIPAIKQITQKSPVPIVADIHFRADLAILAMENGVSKVRINPGNIGDAKKVRMVCDCAKMHNVPIRIGVNSGSIQKDILARDGGVTPQGMLDSALMHAKLLEDNGFHDIVLSLKSTDVPLTVRAYELASEKTDYPLHIGVTEAGLPGDGNIKSAIGIGSLLLHGIGNTVRVSLTGDPLPEIKAAKDILKACGLQKNYVNVISCPTCGRTNIDVFGIATKVKNATASIEKPLTVAVMGCVVNGPGEAKQADIGIAGGGLSERNGQMIGAIFQKDKAPVKVQGDLAQILIDKVFELVNEKQ